ncbi:hypothetical protein L1887_39721 [Cichorium endivia]|nr:hypothetical protein L1887_39721 [Cichorium endivia]
MDPDESTVKFDVSRFHLHCGEFPSSLSFLLLFFQSVHLSPRFYNSKSSDNRKMMSSQPYVDDHSQTLHPPSELQST